MSVLLPTTQVVFAMISARGLIDLSTIDAESFTATAVNQVTASAAPNAVDSGMTMARIATEVAVHCAIGPAPDATIPAKRLLVPANTSVDVEVAHGDKVAVVLA